MKNIITFLSLYTILHSCDPDSYSDFYIENNTDKNIELVKFLKDTTDIKNKAVSIPAKSSYLAVSSSGLGQSVSLECNDYSLDNTNFGRSHFGEDSVQIRSADGIVLKTYYPDDKGKNIYNVYCSWKEVESRKNYKKYTFEITEEDLKQ